MYSRFAETLVQADTRGPPLRGGGQEPAPQALQRGQNAGNGK